MKGPYKNNEREKWNINSWKKYKISQQPIYDDLEALETVKSKLSKLPPIINSKEVDLLKEKLQMCSENKAFIIQAGDCAERFIDAKEEIIERQIIFMNTLSQILAYHLHKDIITIGRIAGQYAKPRSQDNEIIGDKIVSIYRGDIVNGYSPENRKPDPERMLEAYNNSTITINQINNWNFYGDKSIKSFKHIYKENKYGLKSQITLNTLLDYYENFRYENHENFVFTSHEGLLLNYEECLVREINEKYYDLSGHFLWIGERTNKLDEAHIEFFRGIENPIGIKVSSRLNFDDLIATIKLLNPDNKKGKIVLITRFGCNLVENNLETLINKIIEAELEVIYMCDPNHGNTKLLKEKDKKVRYFDDMLNEILATNKILKKNKQSLSGIHLEASSFHVTECLGGLENDVSEIHDEHYTTYCDPRLNMQQAYQICDYVGKFISNDGHSICEEYVSEDCNENPDNPQVESRIIDM